MVGTPSAVHDLLREYYEGLPGELLTDDTNALLGAVLLELQAERMQNNGPTDLTVWMDEQNSEDTSGFNRNERGTYRSLSLNIGKSEWAEIEPDDLGFVAREVDLRGASVDIEVAFQNPAEEEKRVAYGASELPVTGIPVSTANIWVRVDPNAGSSSDTVTVDCWGKN
jgi:hypothetical protein